MAKAASIYRQARITLTEERDRDHPGRVRLTLRVMVKPLQAEWNMRQTVLHVHAQNQAPLSDLNAVYGALLELLAQPPLPGHIDG